MRHDRDQRRALHAREQRHALAGETVTIIRHPDVPVAHGVAQERAERDRTALAPRPGRTGSQRPADGHANAAVDRQRTVFRHNRCRVGERDDAEGGDGGVLAEDGRQADRFASPRRCREPLEDRGTRGIPHRGCAKRDPRGRIANNTRRDERAPTTDPEAACRARPRGLRGARAEYERGRRRTRR